MRNTSNPHSRPFSFPARRRLLLLAFLLLLVLMLACSATDNLNLPFLQGGDLQSAVETGVYQTRQVSELQTAAAGGGGAAVAESTPEPTTDPALSCPAAPPPPDFSTIDLPESLGTLEQQGDQWLLNGTAVELVNHLNADCSTTLWLSLEGHADWPMLVQNLDSGWDLGNRQWTGQITVINTNDVPLTLGLAALDLGNRDGEEPQVQELTPYELFRFAALPPGRYTFSFSFVSDQAFDLACTLDFQPNSRFVFSVVPSGVAVFGAGFVPQTSADVDITSSPLCTN